MPDAESGPGHTDSRRDMLSHMANTEQYGHQDRQEDRAAGEIVTESG